MKIVVAPQAFKRNVSAFEVAKAIKNGIVRVFPRAEIILAPVADGGDGTLDVIMQATDGSYREVETIGPLGDTITAPWGILPDGRTAVIEMAKVCGLALLNEEEQNPLNTSTYGLGEMIKALLDRGYRRFFIGVGGSATNDAGAGMAQALGALLLDHKGKQIERGGAALKHLASIDLSKFDPRVQEAQFIVGCDVSNSLVGPEGASHIYAPQKGADPQMVEQLEEAVRHFSSIVKRDLHKDIAPIKWGGAAGGTAAGMFAFLNASLQSGFDLIMEILNFDHSLEGADLVITGEGRMESQFFFHKAPFGVAKRAKGRNIPVIAIVGALGVGYSGVHQEGINAIFPLTYSKMTLSTIPKNSPELISQAAEQAMRTLKLAHNLSL